MHYYQQVTPRARGIRDAHLASTKPSKRPSIEAIYEPFIDSVLGHQMYWTKAFQIIKEGLHGYPTSLREQHRFGLLETFLEAGEARRWRDTDKAREALTAYGFLEIPWKKQTQTL